MMARTTCTITVIMIPPYSWCLWGDCRCSQPLCLITYSLHQTAACDRAISTRGHTRQCYSLLVAVFWCLSQVRIISEHFSWLLCPPADAWLHPLLSLHPPLYSLALSQCFSAWQSLHWYSVHRWGAGLGQAHRGRWTPVMVQYIGYIYRPPMPPTCKLIIPTWDMNTFTLLCARISCWGTQGDLEHLVMIYWVCSGGHYLVQILRDISNFRLPDHFQSQPRKNLNMNVLWCLCEWTFRRTYITCLFLCQTIY